MTPCDPQFVELVNAQVRAGKPVVLIYDPADRALEETIGDAARAIGGLYQAYGHEAIRMRFYEVEDGLVRVELSVIV